MLLYFLLKVLKLCLLLFEKLLNNAFLLHWQVHFSKIFLWFNNEKTQIYIKNVKISTQHNPSGAHSEEVRYRVRRRQNVTALYGIRRIYTVVYWLFSMINKRILFIQSSCRDKDQSGKGRNYPNIIAMAPWVKITYFHQQDPGAC